MHKDEQNSPKKPKKVSRSKAKIQTPTVFFLFKFCESHCLLICYRHAYSDSLLPQLRHPYATRNVFVLIQGLWETLAHVRKGKFTSEFCKFIYLTMKPQSQFDWSEYWKIVFKRGVKRQGEFNNWLTSFIFSSVVATFSVIEHFQLTSSSSVFTYCFRLHDSVIHPISLTCLINNYCKKFPWNLLYFMQPNKVTFHIRPSIFTWDLFTCIIKPLYIYILKLI